MTDPSLPSASQPGAAPRLSQSEVLRRLRERPRNDERYSESREVGRGAMGAVYRVTDGDLRRQLAMKVMLGDPGVESASEDESVVRRRARFLEEAQVTGQLDHPGIVPVHELGLDSQGRLYFTMKLVRGRDLREVFESARRDADGWNLPRAIGVLQRVCEAMAFAHSKGVVHRDLKPANVMVGRFGEVYVMDWGLARVLARDGEAKAGESGAVAAADASLGPIRTERKEQSSGSDSGLGTMDGDIVGTPSYMAPEQARGRLEDIGPRVDVYSLGAMLYELLSGHAPYAQAGEKPSATAVLTSLMKGAPPELAREAKGAPEELVAICEKAMARDLRQRYADMLEVGEDLRAWLEGRVVRAHSTGAIVEFRKWIGRNRAFAATVAAAITVALGLAATLAVQQSRANDELAVERDAAKKSAEEAQAARTRTEEVNLKLAEEQRTAQRNADEAVRRGYHANVSAADTALRGLDLERARARLDECPPEARDNWEWRYLDATCSPRLRKVGLRDGLAAASADEVTDVNILLVDANATLLVASTGREVRSNKVRDLVRTFSLPALEPLGTFDFGAAIVNEVALSADGRRVAVATSDRTVRIFDARTREQLASWSHKDGVGFGLALDPNAQLLALGTLRKSLRVVEPLSGAEKFALDALGSPISSIAFDPQGVLLALSLFDGRVLVVDVASGRIERELGEKSAPVIDVEFSPDGFQLCATTNRGYERQRWANTVREWSVSTGALTALHDSHAEVMFGGYTARGELQVTANIDGSAWVADRANFEGYGVVTGTLRASSAVVAGRDLVVGDTKGDLRVLSLDRAGSVDLRSTRQGLVHLQLLADPPRALALDRASSLRLWDARAGELESLVAQAVQGRAYIQMAVDAGANRIAAVQVQGSNSLVTYSAHLFSAIDGTPIGEFELEGGTVEGAAALAGDTLALGMSDGALELWSCAAGERTQRFEALGGTPSEMLLFDGGTRALVRIEERGLVVCDAGSGETRRVATPQGQRVLGLQQCEDAQGVWLDLEKELVRLDLATLELGPALAAPRGERTRVHWLRGERRIACVLGSGARSIGIFEPGSEVALLQIGSGEGLGDRMAVSPDGSAIACGTSNGIVRVWTTEPAQLRESARAERRLWDLEGAKLLERSLEREALDLDAAEIALRGDRALNESARTAALRLLRRVGGSASTLRARTRSVLLLPMTERLECQVALWQTLELERIDARSRLEDTLFLQGAARYRLDQLEAALDCFDRADVATQPRKPAPELLAFRAMCLARLGRVDEARALLPEIPALARDAQLVPLVWEASAVVRRASR
jgi:WD40 repeat protein